MLDAAAIHASLAGNWPVVLEQLGIPAEHLRNRHGPCPHCGGRDRFRFDDRDGRGTFFCSHCGAGDAFRLLQLVHGWDFAEARRRVIDVAGLSGGATPAPIHRRPAPRSEKTPAQPTRRVTALLRDCTGPDAVTDVRAYLESRFLWPLPAGCTLRAHGAVDYWQDRERIGAYPALVAEVQDVVGEIVTAHVTYVPGGRKLTPYSARKILSRMVGRRGCAVRLMPIQGAVLGVAEGIETALAAHALHGIPTWAALNTSLLSKFKPPAGIRRLVIFADRDEPGRKAAKSLVERLRGRVMLEPRTPSKGFKDFADVLVDRRSRAGNRRVS